MYICLMLTNDNFTNLQEIFNFQTLQVTDITSQSAVASRWLKKLFFDQFLQICVLNLQPVIFDVQLQENQGF